MAQGVNIIPFNSFCVMIKGVYGTKVLERGLFRGRGQCAQKYEGISPAQEMANN